MKCNDNKSADVIFLKLHPIVNVFCGTFPSNYPADTGGWNNVSSTLFQHCDVETKLN